MAATVKLWATIALAVGAAVGVGGASAAVSDWPALRAQVAALGGLTAPPPVHTVEGRPEAGGLQHLFFEGLPWQGKATRVFACLGLPRSASTPAPGIVLVHGGGGTAFREWVEKWNDHGFAAIAIAVEGQTDERAPDGTRHLPWTRHAWAGPARAGIYGDMDQPLTDQWMYHAVADTIRANSLLRSLAEVDDSRIGIMGVSWGGVIASTVMGVDARFAFAVSVYGCGGLAEADNQYGRALKGSAFFRNVWDPLVWLPCAKMPALWLSWPGDQHFPLDCQAASYRTAPGARMVSLLPGMGHSHPAAWDPPESYAFAAGVVSAGVPWLRTRELHTTAGWARWSVVSKQPVDEAVLVWTADGGFTGRRAWREEPAVVTSVDGRTEIRCRLPAEATAWFLNARAAGVTASSDFQAGVGESLR